uniref:Uncharacterized protein n=1 Tax=Romanomermis culicivorax TaxID=13658 RepID=A0A915HQK2_ROMCU
MSSDQLLNLNLNDFAKACETEFAKIIEESKRNLREKFQMQIARYQRLLVKMTDAYQPKNNVGRRGETLNILSFEREINKHLREREERNTTKVECLVDLNDNIVDVKNQEFVEPNTDAVEANTE